jgi:hypothetical protein
MIRSGEREEPVATGEAFLREKSRRNNMGATTPVKLSSGESTLSIQSAKSMAIANESLLGEESTPRLPTKTPGKKNALSPEPN